ncbi:HNH endonuclease [Cupriavidus sp. KK10]|jgi:5-methylcytosine-specific restriction protein A|uniref:HNH endonuclease signature motif containing protein n=1 Tax=Cupriavidus sp. KK10 TaxID=1478019 RepID=UPI001BAC6A9B|nr:HNH endonuclease [Cupriavidus sp. KK10]
MPAKPNRPCRHPGCGALVNNKDGLCPVHLAQMRQRVNAQRGKTAERGYSGAWRKARAAYLRAHPLCECAECKALGRVLPSTVVDHIKPHRGDMSLFWDRTNWQAMSKPCHDRKTARFDGGFGRPRRQYAP